MRYIKDTIQKTEFSCIDELVQDMVEVILNAEDEYTAVTLVANTDITIEVFKKLSAIEVNGFKTNYGIVGLNTEEYDDLYYLSLGKDGKIWVEPAWHDDNKWHKAGYLLTEGELLYIPNCDVNSEIIETISNNNILIFSIKE